MYKIKNILRSVIVFAVCLFPCITAYAGTLNPLTGDTEGRYIWIVIAVAAVALVVAVISAISSKKKGGKK